MKRVCLMVLCGTCALSTALIMSPREASAIAPFKKEFENKYIKDPGTNDAEKALKTAAETAKCDICHVGPKKKDRNSYGQALAKYLKKADAKDTAKIQGALETVAGEHSDANDPKSPTFGDLLKEGKLPGK